MVENHFHREGGSEIALLILTTAAQYLKRSCWDSLDSVSGSHNTKSDSMIQFSSLGFEFKSQPSELVMNGRAWRMCYY